MMDSTANSTPSPPPSPGATPGDGPRERLARTQAGLLGALVGGAEAPAGFPAERVRAVRDALVAKRLHAVSRAWPALVRCLGAAFPDRFRDYARTNPPPEHGAALADGRRFLGTLPGLRLDDAGRREVLGVDLHYRPVPGGLAPRRGAWVRWAVLPESGRFHLTWRVPLLGVGHLSVPLPAWLAGGRADR